LMIGALLLGVAATAQAAVLGTYDTYDDWEGDGVQPDGQWRYERAAETDGSGPYADMPVWENGAWRFTPVSQNWGSGTIGRHGNHVGWASADNNDIMHAFNAPDSGTYLLLGNVRHNRRDNPSAGSSDGVSLSIRKDQPSGDDQELFYAWPIERAPEGGGLKLFGIGGAAVTDLSAGDEAYFRISAGENSHTGTDGALHRHRVYQLPEPGGPPQTSSWDSTADFGNNVPSTDFGQLGDLDAAGNPVWFYQAGKPGSADPDDYHLLSEWNGSRWSATPDALPSGQPEGYALHSATSTHPGVDNDHSAIRSWLALFDGLVDISYTASDSNPGGGDGVTVQVYRNADLLPGSQLVIPNGGAGGTVDLTDVTVEYGDFLHFAVLPGASASYDGTRFHATIQAQKFIIPEPGTLAIWALLGALGLAAGWRRGR